MALSKEQKEKNAVIKELKALKIEHNEDASTEDLKALLEESKKAAAPVAPVAAATAPEIPVVAAPAEEPAGPKKKKGPATGLFVVIRRSLEHSFEVYSNDIELLDGMVVVSPASSREEADGIMARQNSYLGRR